MKTILPKQSYQQKTKTILEHNTVINKFISFFFVSSKKEIPFESKASNRYLDGTSHGCQSFCLTKTRLPIFYFDSLLFFVRQLCEGNFLLKKWKQSWANKVINKKNDNNLRSQHSYQQVYIFFLSHQKRKFLLKAKQASVI